MAKKSKSIKYTNATICLADRTITETLKDDIRVFSLDKLLSEWDGVDGVCLSIRKDEDAAEDGE